MNLKLNKKVI